MKLIKSLFLLAILLPFGLKAESGFQQIMPTFKDSSRFELLEEAEIYRADNLWEHINGAAPAYLAYDCQGVMTFIVLDKMDSLEMTIDIFNMADSLNAFGIYSSERSPFNTAVNIGSGGSRSENALYFWQSRYYVKLTGYEYSEKMSESLILFSRILSDKIPKQGQLPKLFHVLPKENRIENSERYISIDVLGQKYLTNGFSVNYKYSEGKYRIIIIQQKSPVQAREHFLKYFDYRRSMGEVENVDYTFAENSFSAMDSFYGKVYFIRKGDTLVAILGIKEKDVVKTLFRGILDKMER